LRAGGRGQPASSVSVAPIGAFDLVADLERTAPAGNGAGAGSGNSGATGIGWTGQAYASFDEADVLTFNALAAIRSPLAAGRGRGRLWFEFAGDRPVEAHGEFDLAAPILRTADGAGRLDVLAGRVAARWLEAGGVEITTEGVELVDSTGVAIDAAAGEQRLVFDPDWRLEQARIALAAADADDLLRFARSMPLPAALAERISRWRVG